MKCVQYLLKIAPSLLHALTTTGQLAVHKAAHGGHADVLKALIAAGSHPYGKDGQGKTPLVIATEQGHSNCVDYLIAAGIESHISTTSENAPHAVAYNIPMQENHLSPHFALDEELDSDDPHWLMGELHKARAETRKVKQELSECQKSSDQLKKFSVQLMMKNREQKLKNVVLQVEKEQLTFSLSLSHVSQSVFELSI